MINNVALLEITPNDAPIILNNILHIYQSILFNKCCKLVNDKQNKTRSICDRIIDYANKNKLEFNNNVLSNAIYFLKSLF